MSDSLSPEDLGFLSKIHDRFLKSRLAQVKPVALMGSLIGKLLAVAETKGLNWRAVVVANLPTNIQVALRTWGLTPRDQEAIRYSEAHAAQYITDMGERMKEQVRATVTAGLASGATAPERARALMESYGELNRDWRRIALTEAATAVSNGYLAQQAPGTLVVGDSAVDCCEWCREFVQGRVYRMLEAAPDAPTTEESLTAVWLGKNNIGRSKYPVRADGTERPSSEMWHPCIPAHPTCRCRWRLYNPNLDAIVPGTNQVVDKIDVWGKSENGSNV